MSWEYRVTVVITIQTNQRMSEPEAEQTAIDAIYSDRTRLKRAHPVISPFSNIRAKKDDAEIKWHPGAAKFFSEHGM